MKLEQLDEGVKFGAKEISKLKTLKQFLVGYEFEVELDDSRGIGDRYVVKTFDELDVSDLEDIISNLDVESEYYDFLQNSVEEKFDEDDLNRYTVKNQKDFKVQAMDNWKHGKPYAMVVCPVYQFPARTSQIYQQAGERSVCIATYTHLAVFARYAHIRSNENSIELLHEVFKSVDAMNPSKDASTYWQIVNRTMLGFDDAIREIWKEEKIASVESIHISKEEALRFLATERERIMRLSKEKAIREVLKASKIENKIKAIQSVSDNGILSLGVIYYE